MKSQREFGSVQVVLQQVSLTQLPVVHSVPPPHRFPIDFDVGVGVGNCLHEPSLPATRQDSPLGHTALVQQTPSLPQKRPAWHCESLEQIPPGGTCVGVRVAVAVAVAVGVNAAPQ